MAKYFTPLLRKGTGAFGHQFADQAKQHRAILVNLTAKVGSIGDNGLHKIYNVNAFVCSQLSGIGVFRTAQAIIFQNVKKSLSQ